MLIIDFTTLKTWVKLNKNNALYAIKPCSRAGRKINDDALRAYISENPDAYLSEYDTKISREEAVIAFVRRTRHSQNRIGMKKLYYMFKNKHSHWCSDITYLISKRMTNMYI